MTLEFVVEGQYDGGWEVVYVGEDRTDARLRVAEYRAGERATAFRVRTRRVAMYNASSV